VRVNQVLWHEARSLASLTPADRSFVTRTDDDAKTSVIFGTGERGARVPTGTENVTAIYRTGIGKGGNVIAGQISLLTSRPLGVKEVTNPLRASGGADRESRDQARRNAPLAVAALDRLVSMRDYADFSRTFAGIGKAAAVRLTDGRRRFVHVTIAGANDIPIEPSSDLYRNLGTALRQFGDPYLPIRIDVRERLALVISANVKLLPDYAWEFVEPRIRTALLTAFGYERIDLGRDLLLADALVAVQRIAGVAYVDVDVFDAISETQLLAGFAEQQAQTLARKDRLTIEPAGVAQGVVRAAQIAYLSPDVPDTLILQEIES
jgi:predicted phage baseplate assembly protein